MYRYNEEKTLSVRKNNLGILGAALLLSIAPTGLMAQRAPVNLRSAGNYVVLSETGITDVPPSVITGNIGASPITGAAIHISCAEVVGGGTISSVDAAGPPCAVIAPAALGQAVLDMQTAYADAAGRTIPDFTELGAGDISGRTLVPGLYKWSTGVSVDGTGVTLSGGPNAVWIFQIAGDVLMANNAHVNLAGGAQANNVFWQVGGPTSVTLGTGAVFSGNILSAKQVIMNTGAVLVGRAFAFTQVTLQSTGITTPGPLSAGIPVPLAPTVTSTVPANLSVGVPFGNKVNATFSEAMDPTTINGLTFTLANGLIPVAGLVTYVGVTATFTPSVILNANTTYTATVTTGAKDPAGVAVAANYVWTFTTGAVLNLTPPTVSSTVPANSAVNIPVGNALAATFSTAMDPATITTTTFGLKQGATVIAGAVSYSGVTGTFTPSASLAANTLFTATITTGAKDLSGNALASNYVWTFTTGAAANLTPPTVSSTAPANGAINVPVGSALAATFSEAMNPLTISNVTFTLSKGGLPVAGTVSYAGVTATFTPLTSLTANVLYTATVNTGVKDLSGNALASNYVWTFTPGAVFIPTPPTVTSTFPGNAAVNVPTSSALAAIFSEPIDPLTITNVTFTVTQAGTPVAGTVSYSGVTAIFTPLVPLVGNSLFTATITTGVRDLAGIALATNYSWSFTSGATPDTTPPTVISTLPASGALLVTNTTNVSATFSELMNPLTISTATFLLKQGLTPIPGTVTYTGVQAVFRPATNLTPNTVYTAQITNAATDLAGNNLANYSWTFTTGSANGQTPVCLENFAILAGTSIVSTGATVVTGDIGVSPGASVSGFPPGTLKGTAHGGDAAAASAMVDLTASYNDAVTRSVGPVAISGDIGGQTFTPGLYKASSALSISTGQVTLDAKGNANAVFIFQIASTLTTTAGRQILLVGGAQAFNVFWQVGTSATLGDNSAFVGSILAIQSITLNPGATVNGRLLAENGTVTLQSNIITSPAPSIAVGGIFNAASETQTVAAGSIAAVFGNNFASSLSSATKYPLSTSLGGGSFAVGAQAAPLFMNSCNQANIQIPWESVGQTQVPVTATAGGQSSTPVSATVAPYAPGIFSINMTGSGQGAVEIANTTQLASPAGPLGRPAARGEYIAIFCTGLGPVSNQPASGVAALSNPLSFTLLPATATIGGIQAQVTYSGLAPQYAGLYQVNVLIPDGAPSGSAVSLILSIGGVSSNTVTIALQ